MSVPERYSPRSIHLRRHDQPSALLLRGIEEFNEGRYFDAHETWEEEWQVEKGAQRDFLRGLIHIAAGYHHLLARKNYRGTFIKLGSGSRLLDRFGLVYQGVRLDPLRRTARFNRDRAWLLGPERQDEFQAGWIGPIERTGG